MAEAGGGGAPAAGVHYNAYGIPITDNNGVLLDSLGHPIQVGRFYKIYFGEGGVGDDGWGEWGPPHLSPAQIRRLSASTNNIGKVLTIDETLGVPDNGALTIQFKELEDEEDDEYYQKEHRFRRKFWTKDNWRLPDPITEEDAQIEADWDLLNNKGGGDPVPEKPSGGGGGNAAASHGGRRKKRRTRKKRRRKRRTRKRRTRNLSISSYGVESEKNSS